MIASTQLFCIHLLHAGRMLPRLSSNLNNSSRLVILKIIRCCLATSLLCQLCTKCTPVPATASFFRLLAFSLSIMFWNFTHDPSNHLRPICLIYTPVVQKNFYCTVKMDMSDGFVVLCRSQRYPAS